MSDDLINMDEKKLVDKEKSKILEFKSRVADVIKPELWDDDEQRYLSRWLVARNWNVDKAEAMLRKSMDYRQKLKCDDLMQTYKAPEVLEKYYVGGVCGFDREGSPIWLDPFTQLDTRGILHSVTKDQILLHKLYTCDQLLQNLKSQSEKLNKPVGNVIIIFDVAGLAWRHLWPPGIECFKELISMFEDNYPELLKSTYIINAPRLFILGYSMIKSVISQKTTEKVHVLGSQWKQVLLKVIDADQLPVHYGGTQVDENGDTRCSSKVLYGGEVPKSYYFTHDDISADMQSIHIPRTSSKHIEYSIAVNSCKIRYQIQSEKHDIGFGFLYKPLHSNIRKYSDMEVLQKVERVNTHMVQQTGVLECSSPGTYILVLDNTFSWVKGKTVRYSVEIIAPDVEDDSCTTALDVIGNDESITDLQC